MLQFLVNRRTHRGDIRTFLVGHGEQQCFRAVYRDIFRQVRIFKLHRCHIFQSHDLSAWVRVDDSILHIIERVQALINMDRTAVETVPQPAAGAREALTSKFLRHGNISNAIFRQACGIKIDIYLRVLYTREAHLTH